MEKDSKYRIGKGSIMSIAKAAVVYFHEEFDGETLNYGDLEAMHRIVTLAGAKQQSFFTPAQVSACLANSPYWNKKFVSTFYSGMRGHGGANCYSISDKGKEWYEKYKSSK